MRLGRSVAVIAVLAVAAGGGAWAYQNLSPSPSSDPTSPSASPGGPAPMPSPSPEPEPMLAWGPTVSAWEDALATASALSVEEAAGQVLVMSWNSPDAGGAVQLVSDLHLGGVILMGGAIVDPGQVSELTSALEGAHRADWPLMVGVDQEGGTVARLADVIPPMPAFLAAGAAVDKDTVRQAYGYSAADMAGLGFTVDYAPVADVTIGLADPTIRSRAASDDPQRVADAVVAAVEGFVAGGVVPTVKHFPGHGSVTVDSHASLPVQTQTVAQLEARDLIPFAAAVEAGAPSVMMGHVVVPEWGPEPASLSPAAHAYLRETLGFTGVIVTDALNMGAISDAYGPGAAVVRAIAAGTDVALMPADIQAAHAALVAAVADGSLSRDRLTEAAARSILLMRWQAALPPAATDPTAEYALTMALAGMSVSTPECGVPLVTSPVHITGGFQSERDTLAGFLLQHGITTGRGGSTIQLIGTPDKTGSADVVVALDGPWGLSGSTATSYIGLYGRSADSYAALAAVLAGTAPSGGDWPVSLGLALPACAAR